MPLAIRHSNAFKKDIKRAQKRGHDMEKIKKIIHLLVDEKPLPERHRDHILKGNWLGCRECHIEPDWLLIYAVEDGELHLNRTGSHADLFG